MLPQYVVHIWCRAVGNYVPSQIFLCRRTGANDVMVVVGEKRHLIPYLPGTYVLGVNDEQRVVTVAWDVDF